jgi:prepilin-type N-terminal cleavage/methylation domain-containing protein
MQQGIKSSVVVTGMSARRGFTLVEILIAVAIIGLLATMAVPAFVKARENTQATRVAHDLVKFGDAFDMYAADTGLYPVDTHNVLPPGMAAYIDLARWNDCVIGGNYNWEGPSWGEGGGYNYAGIALFSTPAPQTVLTAIDDILDDGNLALGRFRLMSNGRYTYVLEER